jgi:hypothetical protein
VGRLGFVLAATALSVACTTAAHYTRGPLPTAGLPPARIVTTIAPRPGGPFDKVREERISGTVRDVSLLRDPVHGFTLRMADSRGMTLRVRVDTLLQDVRPDLPRGTLLTIERREAGGEQVRFDDDRGSVAWFHNGEYIPEMPMKLPFSVAFSARPAYRRMFAADDLCRWTIRHVYLEVTPEGSDQTTLLAPGQARRFKTPSGPYLFAALDASTPEESDCGHDGDPHVAWLWIRLSPEDDERLRDRYHQVTTEPHDAGSGMPSPSRSQPRSE